MIVPTPVSVTDGTVAHGATLDVGLFDCPTFLLNRPYCYAYDNAGVSIANTAFTVVGLTSEAEDNDGMHSTSVNPSRITCQTPGLYTMTFAAGFAANTGTLRAISIRLNAAGSNAAGTLLEFHEIAQTTGIVPTSQAHSIQLVMRYRFVNVGDYVEMFLLQNTGGAVNTAIGQFVTYASALWEVA